MPELPEVETTVQGLKKKIISRKIIDLWTDWPKYFRNKREKTFIDYVLGKRITNISRKGKNILIELDKGNLMLIHQKLSGHLLLGRWEKLGRAKDLPEKWQGQKWVPADPKSPEFWNEKNRFIRLIFFLDNGKMLALSDLRRFAKVLCGTKEEISNLPDLRDLGPDPLDAEFTFGKFKNLFEEKRGKIKQILLDQEFISGIGNIYADEVLWSSRIHPLTEVRNLENSQLKALYSSTRKILKRAVELRGTSIDDFRDVLGNKGKYGEALNAYQQEDKPCKRCETSIKRIKINNRSTRYCPKCQEPE